MFFYAPTSSIDCFIIGRSICLLTPALSSRRQPALGPLCVTSPFLFFYVLNVSPFLFLTNIALSPCQQPSLCHVHVTKLPFLMSVVIRSSPTRPPLSQIVLFLANKGTHRYCISGPFPPTPDPLPCHCKNAWSVPPLCRPLPQGTYESRALPPRPNVVPGSGHSSGLLPPLHHPSLCRSRCCL